MAKYDPSIVEKNKYNILSVYVLDLVDLQEGKLPQFLQSHAEMLEAALPYFSEEERAQYQAAIDAGWAQVKFLIASQTVERLKTSEAARMKTIDDFIAYAAAHPA